MTTVFDISLEPLEERYTEQWSRWFPQEFKKSKFNYIKIEGKKLTETIETGSFLDVNSTNYWKASQIMTVAKMFKDKKISCGDIFFVPDMWFPIEMIGYMARLNNINVKIYAFLHAGTYTTEDFASPLARWGKYHEVGWASLCDGIFVGSEYHKKEFLKKRVLPYAADEYDSIRDKIHVTGNPFSVKEVRDGIDFEHKEDTIIFPNRFDYEKRPNIFLDIAQILKSRHSKWKFLITTSRPTFRCSHKWLEDYARALEKQGVVEIKAGISKKEYYEELAKAKVMVSTTIEENFGYCTVEAMALNTIPIVPNRYSNPEIVSAEKYRYNTIEEMINKITIGMISSNRENLYQDAHRYDFSIARMIDVMKTFNQDMINHSEAIK